MPLFNAIDWRYWISYLFETNEGRFNWIGITATLALLTLIWNIWYNRRKYKADLISKSRIQWIESVRPIITDLTSAAVSYPNLLKRYLKIGFSEIEDKSLQEKLLSEANLTMITIQKDADLLRLYIPKSGQDNEEILQSIYNVRKESNDYLYKVSSKVRSNKDLIRGELKKIDQKKLYVSVENLIEVSSIYFKKEWEKAKKGK